MDGKAGVTIEQDADGLNARMITYIIEDGVRREVVEPLLPDELHLLQVTIGVVMTAMELDGRREAAGDPVVV